MTTATSFTSKFAYGLWRPVTAIRRAAEDLNPNTDPDPTWIPLLATPPYPSYAGNASCIGAAGARALQLAFGRDDIPFSVTFPRTADSETVGNGPATCGPSPFRRRAEGDEHRIRLSRAD